MKRWFSSFRASRILLMILVGLLLFPNPANAQINEFDVDAVYGGFEWAPFDGGCEAQTGSSFTGPTDLPQSVPEPYRTIFTDAAKKHNTDVVALAVTFYVENRGFREPPPPYGNGRPWASSSAGAQGPFQFLTSTWNAYKEDGDGDGDMDILDVADASFGAAKYLSSMGAVKGAPLGNGDPNNPYSDDRTIVEAWIGYNWGPGHVDDKDLPLPGETRTYIQLAYPKYLELSGQPPADSEGTGATVCAGFTGPGGGAVGISPDGFAFPLIATKRQIREGLKDEVSWAVWCYNKETSCHHDYNAADIFVETGTVVVAAKQGRVVSTRYSPTRGQNVVIKGDDGFVYFYNHMGFGTLKVQKNQHVNAGTPLGAVGTNTEAQSTPRHLHFDILPPQYSSRVSCSESACSGYPFINPQPPLRASFEVLPEG